ncbi:MAG TPA: protein meaA, partial [Aestuariivirga sp.]|nr:protein meaA [Aestuariivirga sp.]
PSMRLITDTITFSARELPKWNPVNICSYHLQEAGATPVQELAFAFATAFAVLDAVKASGEVNSEDFPQIVGRMSFFVNAGVKLVTEICKMRAFTELWDASCKGRYGVGDEKLRRFRYGVQVNSLGLTEQQPENNVHRILIEMLAVVLSKNARARAVQLPAWNEALGLPRAWDQQWSLRMQQIVAYETDLLDFGDIFEGSKEIEAKVEALKAEATAELKRVIKLGGAASTEAIDYMKRALVQSNTERLKAIETGETKVVGVNVFTTTEPSPLSADGGTAILTVKDDVEYEQIERLKAWRATRNAKNVKAALAVLKIAASEGRNVMEASISCAKAGVTTGEWGETLRSVFGEYRGPTGVRLVMQAEHPPALEGLRQRVRNLAQALGETPKFLVGKPGLDGHSNGAEQIAVRAADTGLEVIYEGIRLTPEELVEKVKERKVHMVGLSILSGSHVPLLRDVMNGLRAAGLGHVPVVAGGIIPPEDVLVLKQLGIAAVYTPRDFDLNAIMSDVLGLLETRTQFVIPAQAGTHGN